MTFPARTRSPTPSPTLGSSSSSSSGSLSPPPYSPLGPTVPLGPTWLPPSKEPTGHYYLITGTPGVGKSSLAFQFPNPVGLCDPTDIGAFRLRESLAIPQKTPLSICKSHEGLLDVMNAFAKDPQGYKTLVFEGFHGWYTKLVSPRTKQKILSSGEDPEAWGGTVEAKKILGDEILTFMQALNEVISAGLNFVATCHTKEGNKPNPRGHNYQTEQLEIPRLLATPLMKNATAVLHIKYVPEVLHTDQTTKGIMQKTGKVRDLDRMIFLNPTAGIEIAKNQFNCSRESITYETADAAYATLLSMKMKVTT